MAETSAEIVGRICNMIPPVGMTLTEDEGKSIMKNIEANVMGAVHPGWTRASIEFQCENCRKEEKGSYPSPDGWYSVPDNVSAYLCGECLSKAAKKFLW